MYEISNMWTLFKFNNFDCLRIFDQIRSLLLVHENKSDIENFDNGALIELEGITDLFKLLNIEMDRQVDWFNYKGAKYKLNFRKDVISQDLYKFLSSSIPK